MEEKQKTIQFANTAAARLVPGPKLPEIYLYLSIYLYIMK